MAALDELVSELDRSYAEAQERMSDPAVYNDHREAAEVGRRLKELEGPWKLAQQWKQARADLRRARRRRARRDGGGLRGRRRAARGGAEARARRARPGRRQGRDRRDPRWRRRRRGQLWAGDLAKVLQRYAERRGFRWEEIEVHAERCRRRQGRRRSRSRATAPTRCSSSKAGRIACSACRRPSRRGASTRRRRPSR